MKKLYTTLFIISVFSLSSLAQKDIWNTLVSQNVEEDGRVNYDKFYNDRDKLQEYLNYMASSFPGEAAHNNEKLAYWINLYNASTVYIMSKQIKEEYAVCIYLIDGIWNDPLVSFENEKISLNEIDKIKILGSDLFDPRVHFALVYASQSCPKLRNEEYSAKDLNSQLEDQTYAFINNNKKNHVDKEKVEISAIFKWYERDFDEVGGVVNYLNKYSNVKVEDNANITYLKFDWMLNH